MTRQELDPSSSLDLDVLKVQRLRKTFRIARQRVVTAIDDVSFSIAAGETLALVGESGSGKTTVGRCLLRVLDPDSGQILVHGVDIAGMKSKELRSIRQKVQIVFQDPSDSLNPRRTIRQSIYEPLGELRKTSHGESAAVVAEMLRIVGLDSDVADKYPRDLTSGEQQRVAVARALATSPDLIVLDEPTSALDPISREHLVELLIQLQRDLGLALLFISHDLVTVRHIADRVAVMYLGEIVESGSVAEIFLNPTHPYTQALIGAVPAVERVEDGNQWVKLEGEIPSPIDLPVGCYLASRCAFVIEGCRIAHPELLPISDAHLSRCARTTGVLRAISPQEVLDAKRRENGGELLEN